MCVRACVCACVRAYVHVCVCLICAMCESEHTSNSLRSIGEELLRLASHDVTNQLLKL